MAKKRTTKQLAQRIDPTYFRKGHPLRRIRRLAGVGLFAAAALWVALSALLGDDRVYANGPVSEGHALIEEDCAKCHAEAFGPVRDASCLECHAVGGHVPLKKGPGCVRCHTEHRGNVDLSRISDAHCNRCHLDHSAIERFDHHIEFRLKPREQHIRFSHAKHVKPDLLGGPVDCADCHDDRPISFDAHCARCHTERLDETGGVPVPHGFQPDRLREWIAAVMLRRLREQGGPKPARESSVPGRGAAKVPEWAEEIDRRAGAALEALFRPKGGCLVCHVEAEQGVRVPEIPRRWLSRARFDHDAHRTEACATCHGVARSEDSDTLSLPNVFVCRECHKPGGARDGCVTCHPYHR